MSSYFSIVVKIHQKEEMKILNRIQEMDNPDRVRIILFLVRQREKYYNDFPVNLLRNIGIVNIITSHYIVLDMDMWPNRIPWSFIHQQITFIQRFRKSLPQFLIPLLLRPLFRPFSSTNRPFCVIVKDFLPARRRANRGSLTIELSFSSV